MISVIITAISIVVIIVVSVLIFVNYEKIERDRKTEMDQLVQRINLADISNRQINDQQSKTLTGLSENVTAVQTTIQDTTKSIDSIKTTAVTKDTLSKEVTSSKATFDTLALGGVKLSAKDNNLMVDGSVWTKGGLSTSVGDKFASVVSTDDKQIYLNKSKLFANGVHVGDKMNIDAWTMAGSPSALTISSGSNATWSLDSNGRMTISAMSATSRITVPAGVSSAKNADNLPSEFPSISGSNIIRGDTRVVGNLNIGDGDVHGLGEANDKLYAFSKNGMILASKNSDNTYSDKIEIPKDGAVTIKPFSVLEKGSASKSFEVNNVTGYSWGMTLNGNDLAFVSNTLGTGTDVNTKPATVRFDSDGSVYANAGNFSGNVVGANVCSGTQCMSPADVQNVKSVIGNSNIGNLANGVLCSGTQCLSSADVESVKGIVGASAANRLCIGTTCLTADDIQKLQSVIVPKSLRRYPPGPPTSSDAFSLTITGAAYGNGRYDIGVSSWGWVHPSTAFIYSNRGSGNMFHSLGAFNSVNGVPVTNANVAHPFKNAASINGIVGEWVSIQLPNTIKLKKYAIYPRMDFADRRSPKEFVVFGGSLDGSQWTLLDDRRGGRAAENWTQNPQEFTVDSQTYYDRFMLLTTRVGNDNANNARDFVNFERWELYEEV